MGKYLKKAFIRTLPVLAGYVFLGFAFGLLMRTKGFSVWIPVVMSILIYSGALEFAAVPMLTEAFDPFGAFIIGITLSARHLFYGIPMLKKYSGTGLSKLFLIFGLTDETFSLLSASEVPEGLEPKPWYISVTALNFSYWVGGSTLGAVAGGFIRFGADGLDFALTALFVVLFLEQLGSREGKISGFLGLLASAAVLALFGSRYFVLISMGAILVLLIAGKKVIGRD